MKYYGLIFDVDGVIADTESVNSRATIKVFDELFGVKDVVRSDFEAGLGRGAEEYVKAAAKIKGLKLTPEQIKEATKLRQQYFLDILSSQPLWPYPGVLELMNQALESEKFKVAVATSSTREKSEAVLKSAKIPYEKMIYVTGDEVKNKKPHPELLITAAKKLRIEPSDCAVIEDAPNGIAAAKAAKAFCVAVTNTTPAQKLEQADLICDSLKDISLEQIQSLFTGE